MDPKVCGAAGAIQSFVAGRGKSGEPCRKSGEAYPGHARAAERRRRLSPSLADRKAVGGERRAPKERAGGRRLLPTLGLAALLGLPGVSQAFTLANAVSSTVLTCGSFQALLTKAGESSDDCALAAGGQFSPASATVRTLLGASPTATVSAMNEGAVGKSKFEAQASAHLTYEVRVVELATPPTSFTGIPVTVAVRGEVKRDSQRANVTTAPLAIGTAYVTMRSSPDIPWVKGDVLNERAVRTPQAPSQDTPDFDKIVAISLLPGHTYLVDLVAGCRLTGGSGSFETVSSRSSCSAEADPVFGFDQAALDKRLGASSFSLASYYGFEYSAGVSSPVPEPAAAGLLVFGLAGLAAYSRRLRPRGTAPHAA